MGGDGYILRERESNAYLCETKTVKGLVWAINIQKAKPNLKMRKCSLSGYCEATVSLGPGVLFLTAMSVETRRRRATVTGEVNIHRVLRKELLGVPGWLSRFSI